MSIDKFKFVSPGVFVHEIDNSLNPRISPELGPVIVGTSQKGPMMRPVRVQSFDEFVQVFGEPLAGGQGGDVWRNGNKTAPTYGVYAAQAYLKNSGPVTFVRLGGYENPDKDGATSPASAGWAAKKAYGLFVMPISKSSNDNIFSTEPGVTASAELAAILYTTADATTVSVSGKPISGSSVLSNVTGTFVRAGSNVEFDVTIGGTKKYTINFNESSKKYIRTVLNANPIMTNSSIVSSTETYFLGESYASNIDTSKDYAVCAIELNTGSVSYVNFNKKAEKAETSWIYSQHLESTGSYTKNNKGEYPVTKLFKFVGLSEGSWNNENIKISVEDIKASTNRFIKFGSFTVSVRKMDDTDANPMYLERFGGLSLDPFSENFISKKIGDKYSEWDYDEKKFKEFGTYANKSKYIRVEVNPDVETGLTDPSLLPFGFFVNEVFSGPVFAQTGGVGDFAVTSSITNNGELIRVHGNVTGSIKMPQIPLLESSADCPVASLAGVYWGLKTNLNETKKVNFDMVDYLRTLPVRTVNASGSTPFFSLDDVSASYTSSGGNYKITTKDDATWTEGNRYNGSSLTATGLTAADGSPLILSVFNKFTLPLVGGFDGFDITEKSPFNKRVLSDKNANSSYAYNSVKVAIESITDPEVVEGNLAAIPGIEEESLTSLLIEKCENRGDMLAVIDLEGDYVPEEGKKTASQTVAERRPSVDTVVRNLTDRALNTSYGCSFFPWVLVRDTLNNNTVWVPPSVVALGTFSSSQAKTELWFAPAGFNRGGLTDGAGGLPVVQTALRLSSKDRDKLYEANINPIATFPAEGIVVFGQKTLQVTSSALDRINVRRLMIYIKKEISRMATRVLFDPNVEVTWRRFLSEARPFLESVQTRFGISDFRLILDGTTTTPDLVDRNIVYAKVMVKPTRAIEFMAIDFVIANTGASFND